MTWTTGYVTMKYQYFLKYNLTDTDELCLKPDGTKFVEEWHNYTKDDVLWIGQEVNVTDPLERNGTYMQAFTCMIMIEIDDALYFNGTRIDNTRYDH